MVVFDASVYTSEHSNGFLPSSFEEIVLESLVTGPVSFPALKGFAKILWKKDEIPSISVLSMTVASDEIFSESSFLSLFISY